MDLRGEEARKLLGEESYRHLQDWLESIDPEKELEMEHFEIKDEAGETIAEFESTHETAALMAMLITRAIETQREKLAAWMIKHEFSTGHGDTQEDLLKELSWQVKELRADLKHLQTELEDESV